MLETKTKILYFIVRNHKAIVIHQEPGLTADEQAYHLSQVIHDDVYPLQLVRKIDKKVENL